MLDTRVEDLLNVSETRKWSTTQLLVYDLNDNDNLIRRYELPKTQVNDKSLFANIAVEDGDCDNTFAYLADLGAPGLVVYSWKLEKSWRVNHHFFHPDPLAGNYSIGGISFQWPDGLFGVTLTEMQPDGFAILYFHPLSSTDEFAVSTRVLHNETLATSQEIYRNFALIGSRGLNGQSGASFYDQTTKVIFYTMPNMNKLACWRTTSKKNYSIESGNVYESPVELVFPNDVKVDDKNRLWVLSDNLQKFIYAEMDKNIVNFRILSANVKDAIKNTECDTSFIKETLTKTLNTIKGIGSGIAKKSGADSVFSSSSFLFTLTAFIAIFSAKYY